MLMKTNFTARRGRLRGALLVIVAILVGLTFMSPVRPQSALRLPAPDLIQFPSQADSNSPLIWLDDQLYLFTSTGATVRSSGTSPQDLSNPQLVTLRSDGPAGPFPSSAWLESISPSTTSPNTLYGWYHHEIYLDCSPGVFAEPVVGAAVSYDNGESWLNLGLVLTAPPGSSRCTYQNGYFLGGHGDFSVIKQGAYFYIFYTNYALPFEQQGVSVARMHEADLDAPINRVFKYYNGAWTSPGLGGAGTPIWRALASWEQYDPDSYWGPSLHYNYHLNSYVILMNRAIAHGWVQGGIYYSFNANLENPSGWSAPAQLNMPARSLRWYPEAVGTAAGETNSYLGLIGRLFTSGTSNDYIRFFRAGEPVFTVNPASLCPATPATAAVTNATPGSTVRLVEEKLISGQWQVVYDNPNEGTTDVQGEWTYPASYIPGVGSGPYRAYVEVAGLRSDYADYELVSCP